MRYKIGDRVRITAAPDKAMVGKVGTIVDIKKIQGYNSPLISLDGGGQIGGWQCWWEPVTSIPTSNQPTAATLWVKKRDIKHIRISCRCGKVSIAEIPIQIADGLNLHPCPGCRAGYSITYREQKWIIERIAESIQDLTFTDNNPKKDWRN